MARLFDANLMRQPREGLLERLTITRDKGRQTEYTVRQYAFIVRDLGTIFLALYRTVHGLKLDTLFYLWFIYM